MRLIKLAALCIFLCSAAVADAASVRYGWGSLQSLEKAARKGRPSAQAELGRYYLEAQEYRQALPWLQKAAKRGDAEGLFGLGFCYETGFCGEKKNIKKAVKYYKKSARKKSPNGLYKTAVFLYGGVSGKAQLEKAIKYMSMAAEEGSGKAGRFLAEYYAGDAEHRDYEKSAEYWEMLARDNDAQACFNLGQLYWKGLGVGQDFRRGFEWVFRSAELGLAEGAYQTGLAYMEGKGVERNDGQGVYWLKRAAAEGLKKAEEKLK